ncbi:MAG TPA: hypothetical protein VEN78_02580 [Bradyrhizobium sp.]|nr:hypothetical protein [Bradyrhizobium sp.]
MKTMRIVSVVGLSILIFAAFSGVQAQQPQVPTLQVCNETQVQGKAVVKIGSRVDVSHSGTFTITIEVKCNRESNNGYPAGTFQIINLSMSDSIVQGTIAAISLEQVTSTGKHTPTAYLNGRCRADKVIGCRFWLMLADNKKPNQSGTPDVVSFLVFNSAGQRVAYGTGPVVEGDIQVAPTSN